MMFVSFVGMARSTKSHKALTTMFTTHNLSSQPLALPKPSIGKLFVSMVRHGHQSALLKISSSVLPQGFLPELLRNSHIIALLQGNLTSDDAMSIASAVRASMSDGIMTVAERPLDRVTRLPKGTLLHRSGSPLF